MIEPRKGDPVGFRLRWLTEAVRAREEREGALERDAPIDAESGGARCGESVLLARGLRLAQRAGLDIALREWERRSLWSLALVVVGGLLSGFAAALAVLGDGGRPVNVVWALGGLLGVPTLSLAVWLAAMVFAGRGAGGFVGRSWLWLQKRLSRAPATVDLAAGLASLLRASRLGRWWVASVTHGIWLAALTGALSGLLVGLSARRYEFVWETTILPPEVFVALVSLIGWLPAQLGFMTPDADLVRASGELAAPGTAGRVAWASWLLGALTVFGLLPRVVLWAICFGRWRVGAARVRLDTDAPYYALLLQRLMPGSARIGVTDADVHPAQPSRVRGERGGRAPAALVGLELGPGCAWPPCPGLDVRDLGVVDDRRQRQAALAELAAAPPGCLLIVCDGRQTPDRGSLEFIAAAASHAAACRVVLQIGGGGRDCRPSWRERLAAIGFDAAQICDAVGTSCSWLTAAAPERGDE